jgi:uncharacterized protein (UPF0264 family)
MAQLLVSVRSAAEAEAALAGGAALIDVKEPTRGALGRADDAVIDDVVRAVAGRAPVSAALGELETALWEPFPSALESLAFVKWGAAGYRGNEQAWAVELHLELGKLREAAASCRPVAAAYADWRRAKAPPPDEVCAFACRWEVGAFLIDTWGKDGSTLLSWLSEHEAQRLCERAQAAGVRVALAGALGVAEIRRLLPARPDWFAVRTAVCQGRRRNTVVEEGKVRQLAQLLAAEGT